MSRRHIEDFIQFAITGTRERPRLAIVNRKSQRATILGHRKRWITRTDVLPYWSQTPGLYSVVVARPLRLVLGVSLT